MKCVSKHNKIDQFCSGAKQPPRKNVLPGDRKTRVTSFIFYSEVYLIYNVVLISAVQQSDSAIHIYISIFFSIMDYPRMLNILPCTVQQDPVVYPSCKRPTHPSPAPPLPWKPQACSLCPRDCFVGKFIRVIF